MFGVTILISLLTLAYVTYVIFSLQPTALQVAVHYSAFGSTHFYREKWYYLISFAVFGVVMAISHIAIMIKLNKLELRPLGLAFGWLTIVTLGIATVLTHSVFGVAFLS